MTAALKELKGKIDAAEADGAQVIGVHLTREMAKQIHWELHQMYGHDPMGDELTLVYGIEILSEDAEELKLET